MGCASGGEVLNGVLVVDDMPQTRRFVCRVLDREGFRTFEAENGATAYAAARSHVDDIVLAIIDVDLPGANGKEVSAALRKTIPHARHIFMTGFDISMLKAEGRLPDNAVVLRKPFTMTVLLDTVRDNVAPDTAGLMAPADAPADE